MIFHILLFIENLRTVLQDQTMARGVDSAFSERMEQGLHQEHGWAVYLQHG
jgi:hypothetical protein